MGSMSPEVNNLINAIERVASGAPASEIPVLLVELERLRAALWVRLVAPSRKTSEGRGATDGNDRLLTVPEVADRLAVRPARVYEMIRLGGIPVVRFGKYVRVPASDLLQWLEQHREKPFGPTLYTVYSQSRDKRARRDAKANSKATRADAVSSRRKARRQS